MQSKVIVLVHHDRHTDDVVHVYSYSESNVQKVEAAMKAYWQTDGTSWGFFGDLPCSKGKQYGCNDDYYSSYAIVEVEDAI